MRKYLAFVVVLALCGSVLNAQDKKGTPDEQFKKLDANNDGKLSKAEFVGKRTGDKASKAEETFKKKDKNADGSLDLEEFKAGAKKPK